MACYSFTLHDPDSKRIMGFDNAHTVAPRGRYGRRQQEADHWHRDENDKGTPYQFRDVETLIADFLRRSNAFSPIAGCRSGSSQTYPRRRRDGSRNDGQKPKRKGR